MRLTIERVTLGIFASYACLIPGSSLLVALDLVPAWGRGFGGTLLLLQGATMLAWLTWRYGRRGAMAGILVALLGFAVEYIGETTGFPFGRYTYTDLVWPKVFGTVPLAICAAWMMVAAAAYEIARQLPIKYLGTNGTMLITATLVLILDLQIETVAALINNYWVWNDSGPYYGVPTANFVAWWLVGLGMAWVLERVIGSQPHKHRHVATSTRATAVSATIMTHMPALLYLLSTGMFAVINLARGYVVAGLIGVAVLVTAGTITGYFGGIALRQIARRQYD